MIIYKLKETDRIIAKGYASVDEVVKCRKHLRKVLGCSTMMGKWYHDAGFPDTCILGDETITVVRGREEIVTSIVELTMQLAELGGQLKMLDEDEEVMLPKEWRV